MTREGAGDLTLEPLEFLEAMGDWQADGRRLYQQRAANACRLGRPAAAFDAAELIWQVCRAGPTQRAARFPISRAKMKELLQSFGNTLSLSDKSSA